MIARLASGKSPMAYSELGEVLLWLVAVLDLLAALPKKKVAKPIRAMKDTTAPVTIIALRLYLKGEKRSLRVSLGAGVWMIGGKTLSTGVIPTTGVSSVGADSRLES